MWAQTKRYKVHTEETNKERQLSSLFSIISNNIMLATEVLSTDYKIKAVRDLQTISKKAKTLADELVSKSHDVTKEEISEKVSSLKQQMLALVIDLTEELTKLDKSSNQKTIEDIILARRLLRESQRGLATIQD